MKSKYSKLSINTFLFSINKKQQKKEKKKAS